ncbi:hypothetical protein PT273_06035 [Orbaceae bacterium ESL0727]|nr:hypothetical protein [Orbaceae bacterium ESL0727]
MDNCKLQTANCKLQTANCTSNTLRRTVNTLLAGAILAGALPAHVAIAALKSSVTTNTIQGTAPYLTFDNGLTKARDVSQLLSIRLSNNSVYFSGSVVGSSASNPIELPAVGQTMANVSMIVPTDRMSVNLSDLIGSPYNYGKDDNGDTFSSASGSVNLTITDATGQSVARNTTLYVLPTCSNPNPAQPYTSPFKVILSSTAGTLITQYGNPNSTNYAAATATYYIKPNASQSLRVTCNLI